MLSRRACLHGRKEEKRGGGGRETLRPRDTRVASQKSLGSSRPQAPRRDQNLVAAGVSVRLVPRTRPRTRLARVLRERERDLEELVTFVRRFRGFFEGLREGEPVAALRSRPFECSMSSSCFFHEPIRPPIDLSDQSDTIKVEMPPSPPPPFQLSLPIGSLSTLRPSSASDMREIPIPTPEKSIRDKVSVYSDRIIAPRVSTC